MSSIYCLKLQENKYYVGRTDNINIRLQQHSDGIGSTWTKKYPPLEVMFVKGSTSPFDEDKFTKEMMMAHGIDNVRGGSYVTDTIDHNQRALLQKEIWGSMGLCIRCGNPGHLIDNCTHSQMTKLNIQSTPNPKSIVNKPTNSTNKICKRCNRLGHSRKDCFATTKLDGTKIRTTTCKRCGRTGHTAKKCFARNDVNNNVIV